MCRLREDKEGIEHSAVILRAAVAELAAYLALPVQRIVLGGSHSQLMPVSLFEDVVIWL